MDTTTQAGLIDTGGQVAGGLLTYGLQMIENQKNRRFNAEQAELAYQRQLDMMDKQNEYNTPLAQMQRYKDAGLNPNLVAGGQSNLSAPAAAAPQAAGANGAISPVPIQSNLLQAKLADAQIQKLNAETKMTYEQVNTIVKMREPTYNKLNAESQLLSQQFRTQEVQALLADIKSHMLNANIQYSKEYGHPFWSDSFESLVTDRNGDFKPLFECVVDTFAKDIQNAEDQAMYFIDGFLAEIGLKQANRKYQELLNDDMKEWLQVCATIYQGQGSQASYVSAMSQLNEDFLKDLDMAPEAIKWITQFISMFLGVLPNVNFSHSTKTSTFNKNVTYSE